MNKKKRDQSPLPPLPDHSINHPPDVLLHHLLVHPDERHGEGVADKRLFDRYGFSHDLEDALPAQLGALELGVEEAGEVAVQALVPGDELVGEGQALGLVGCMGGEGGGGDFGLEKERRVCVRVYMRG